MRERTLRPGRLLPMMCPRTLLPSHERSKSTKRDGSGGKNMDSEYNPITIFSGNANKPLAEKVASYLGIPLGQAEVGRFPDGEIKLLSLIHISEPTRPY